MRRKVEGWISEIEKLSTFVVTQPHAVYAAFAHGLVSRWNYLLRVIDWDILSSIDLLQPLESVIRSQFIPAVTGQAPPGRQMRELLALPARFGGLGIQNPITMAEEQHTASKLICAPLVDRIVNQDHRLTECHALQQRTKARLCSHRRNQQKEEAKNLQDQVPSTLQCSMELSQEKGASAWLTSVPIDDHGFALPQYQLMTTVFPCASLLLGMLSLSPVWLVIQKSTITLYLRPSIQR